MWACTPWTNVVYPFAVHREMEGCECLTFHASFGFVYALPTLYFFTFDDYTLADRSVGVLGVLEGHEDEGGALTGCSACDVFKVFGFRDLCVWEVVVLFYSGECVSGVWVEGHRDVFEDYFVSPFSDLDHALVVVGECLSYVISFTPEGGLRRFC